MDNVQYNTVPVSPRTPIHGVAAVLTRNTRQYAKQMLALSLITAALMASAARGQESESGSETVANGTLDVIIVENFDQRRSELVYFLRGDRSSRPYELKFKRQPAQQLRTGQRVTVRGRAEGRRLWVDTLSDGGTTRSGAADAEDMAVPAVRRAVVLLVDLLDKKASARYSLSQIAANLYTGTRSVAGLYGEASFSQLSFEADTDGDGAPDVFGPFTIAYDSSDCNYYSWASAAESAAQAAGINLALYQHRIFVLPRYSDLPACSWAGIANVGCGTYCRVWIAEGESPMVYAHELGHNLRMGHAGTDPDNDGKADNAYGDYSDPMGLSRSWHLFNAPHADQMQWYAAYPDSIALITTSGIYHLAPLESDPAYVMVPQLLKFKKPDRGDGFYYVSYRQPVGYDSSLSSSYTRGVNIHRYQGSSYQSTYLIKSLSDGESFSDSEIGITVTQLSHDPDYATVSIDLGGGSCTPVTPAVTLAPASQTVRPGSAVSYAVAVSNKDGSGCGPTTLELSYSGTPVGSLTPSSLTLTSGQSGSATLELTSTLLTDGSYTLAVQATDSDGAEPNHTAPGAGKASVLVDGTPPTAPGSLKAYKDRRGNIRLSWSAATDALSGISGYTVYRDGNSIGQTAGTSYTDTSAVKGTTYTYTVTARDGAGNQSQPSNELSVSVGSTGRSSSAPAPSDTVRVRGTSPRRR
jgi:hypothetical protein